MAIAEVTVIPVGTDSTSLSAYVAHIQTYLQEEQRQGRITFELTAMSTILEGELDELFRVIRHMHELPYGAGVQRVCTSVKLDDRRDREGSISQKLHSVAEKLQGGGQLASAE